MRSFKKILQYTLSILALVVVSLLVLYGFALASADFRDRIHSVTHETALEGFVNRILPHGESGDESKDATGGSSAELVEIVMNEQALRNSGIDDSTLATVTIGSFGKTLDFPAIVVERPGRSLIKIPSPVSGVVSKIFADPGTSVDPGEPLFEITLTHQDLVQTQTDLITLLQKRDIIQLELERLDAIGTDVAPKSKREIAFQQKENDSAIENQRNLLRLQGLSDKDISETVEKERKIVQTMIVRVPKPTDDDTGYTSHPVQINDLLVDLGQKVDLGEQLCHIGDLCQLLLEGKSYAYDEPMLLKALMEKQPVSATFEGKGGVRETVENLLLRSVENRIDTNARTQTCFVELPNKILLDEKHNGDRPVRRFITWQFKPGQRCELNVQYETITNCIVLPVDSIARELNETSVFEWVGNEEGKKIWRKRPVHLLYQTKSHAVLANDGSIFPDAVVATKGATFLLNALNALKLKPKGGSDVIDHGDHVH